MVEWMDEWMSRWMDGMLIIVKLNVEVRVGFMMRMVISVDNNRIWMMIMMMMMMMMMMVMMRRGMRMIRMRMMSPITVPLTLFHIDINELQR
jgi:hypothetical protein